MEQRIILLVEDDHEMRSLLFDELCNLGYVLKQAINGEQALEYLLEGPPALIVTDLRLPAGGLDYVEQLRRVAPECPIIVMTSFGDARTRTEVMQIGVAAYFDKPVRLSDLKAAILQLLNLERGSIAPQR
jgi:DNA-binding NtrC family response regulator